MSNQPITRNAILKQAGMTAQLLDEKSVDMLWEFAYTTYQCIGEDDRASGTLKDLEAAFEQEVTNAGIKGVPASEHFTTLEE